MNNQPVNEQIRSNVVIVIASDGTKKGQFTKAAAIQFARNEGLDLVQVSQSQPPVCKITDFGKMRYEKSKSEKKHNKQPEQKEMWFHIDTAQHDIDIKMKKVLEWMKKGHKVRFVVKLDGRERYSETHRTLAKDMLSKFAESNKAACTMGQLSTGLKDVSAIFSPAN